MMAGSQEGVCGIGLGERAIGKPRWFRWVAGGGLFVCDGVFQDVALGFCWGMAGSREGVCGIGLREWAIGKPRRLRWGCWGVGLFGLS